jgi:arylsulfatase A-like enzyme
MTGSRPPNVVLIVMDTARARDVGLDSNDPETAPTLRAMAERGTRFTDAHAAAPWTLPSHASLFTGTYPSKHGAHAGHKQLDDRHRTLAESFGDAGYETVAVTNNTWISEEFGFGRGFEEVVKTWQYMQSDTDFGQIARTTEGIEMIGALARQLFTGNPVVNAINAVYGKFGRKRQDKGAARTNRLINEWLGERSSDQPFFLFVNYLEPHLEYDPPREYAEPFLPTDSSYEAATAVSQDAWSNVAGELDLSDHQFELLRALYRGEIAYLDDRIGELREAITDATGRETVFVVTADHGENIGEHELMDHQYALYETLLRVPLIAEGGPFDGGGSVDDLVQLTDIAPTLLETADIDDARARNQFQGQSFHPDRDADPREYVFAEYLAPQPSMDALVERVGTLSPETRRFDRSLRSVRTEATKLIRSSEGSTECYRLDEDPDERHDLSERQPELATQLDAQIDEWLDSFEQTEEKETVDIDDETRDRLEQMGYI